MYIIYIIHADRYFVCMMYRTLWCVRQPCLSNCWFFWSPTSMVFVFRAPCQRECATGIRMGHAACRHNDSNTMCIYTWYSKEWYCKYHYWFWWMMIIMRIVVAAKKWRWHIAKPCRIPMAAIMLSSSLTAHSTLRPQSAEWHLWHCPVFARSKCHGQGKNQGT